MLPILLALAIAAPAASAGAELARSGGLLGGSIDYVLSGDAGEPYYFLPSVTSGPIPLALLDGIDPRVLDVGTELLALAQLGFLDGAGKATVSFALPLSPNLAGFPFHAQFFTFPGAPTFADDLSNRASTVLALGGFTHETLGAGDTARQGHSLTLLGDGRALVAGGDEPDGLGGLTALATLELYDPASMTFMPAGNMTRERSTHTATTLADGRVLLVGGYDATGIVNGTAEIFDPVSGMSTAVGSMSQARTQHTATLLGDGRVLVVGGAAKFDLNDVFGSLATAVSSTELFDPVMETWSAGPALPYRLFGQSASRLQDGRVLITGGVKVNIVIILPVPQVVPDCRLFDPVSNTFGPAAGLSLDRVYHGQRTLTDGSVLVVGGADADFTAGVYPIHAAAERYDAGLDSWTPAGSLSHARAYPNLVDTPSGMLVLGGLATVNITTGSGTPETKTELLAPDLVTWQVVGDGLLPREVARSVPIEDGARVLTVGTGDDGQPLPDVTAEVFVP
jgi:hypothetical protein